MHDKKKLQESPLVKRPLSRPKLGWEDYIRKDFLNIMEEDDGNRNWKGVAENREE